IKAATTRNESELLGSASWRASRHCPVGAGLPANGPGRRASGQEPLLRKSGSHNLTPLLPIPVQEVGDPANRHFQIILAGQGDDAEVVRPGPVEGGALNHKNLLLQQ